jgi:hypothetical protein
MRNNAKDANVPRRIDGPGEPAVPAASAASTTASASDGNLPGWIGAAGWLDLPGSAAATAATAGAQIRRTRIILLGPAPIAPALLLSAEFIKA